MNTYRTMIHGICPSDGTVNYYEVTIRSHPPIRCELIVEACKELRGSEMTQEDMNTALSDKIPGAVTLVGQHCGISLETTH